MGLDASRTQLLSIQWPVTFIVERQCTESCSNEATSHTADDVHRLSSVAFFDQGERSLIRCGLSTANLLHVTGRALELVAGFK